jgi:hypothetical protein
MSNTPLSVTIRDLKYIVLEGGGGKGAAYVGMLNYLQDTGILPIKVEDRIIPSTNDPDPNAGPIDSQLISRKQSRRIFSVQQT